MAKLTLYASARLAASRATRTLSGTLLPYGEVGVTNLGKLRASAGRLQFAAGLLPLNLDHNADDVVGHIAHADDTPARLAAAFTINADPAGDAAIADAELAAQLAERNMPTGKLRCHLSIEVDDCIVRGGELMGGTITGAALVEQPAFAGARLNAAELDDVPDMGDDEDEADNQSEADEPSPPAADDPSAPAGDVVAEHSIDETHTYVAPDGTAVTTTAHTESTTTETQPNGATMTAARVQTPGLAVAKGAKPAIGTNKLFAALAGFNATPGARLEAALADITPANILGVEQPQYVGQLWDGTAYERIYIPAFNHADLTSMKVSGWRFKDGKKPQVAKYSGNKAAVPSNAVETEPHEVDAYRIAGGWDIDRKFRDFSNESFWAAFFAAAAEDCKLKSDLYAFDDIKAAATAVTLDTIPAGVDPAMAAVVRGIVTILKETRTLADGAFVNADLWEQTMLTRADDMLPMLNAMLNFREGTLEGKGFQLAPSADLEANEVLVKVRSAATIHELGGEAPIRVEALDIAKGGIDEGVFAYQAVDIHNAKGLALVTIDDEA